MLGWFKLIYTTGLGKWVGRLLSIRMTLGCEIILTRNALMVLSSTLTDLLHRFQTHTRLLSVTTRAKGRMDGVRGEGSKVWEKMESGLYSSRGGGLREPMGGECILLCPIHDAKYRDPHDQVRAPFNCIHGSLLIPHISLISLTIRSWITDVCLFPRLACLSPEKDECIYKVELSRTLPASTWEDTMELQLRC